jgi:zinc transport system substrate-binding protein
VTQARALEHADLIVLSGGGLEDFMTDLLAGKQVLDSSRNVPLLESCHDHDHHDHDHHQEDAHIWLSPANARIMAVNIYEGLCLQYPQHKQIFAKNLTRLLADVDALEAYGTAQLSSLSCRELITFHDGFAYFAEAFDLTILSAVEEESGSEASAAELKSLICQVREHQLPAIFTETNGSTAAAQIISAETGAAVYALDMAMAGNSWLEAMYKNIDTVKEALG